MTSRTREIAFAVSCIVAGLSINLHAEGNVGTSLQLQMGLATSQSTSFYRGKGEEYFVFPLVMAEYGRYYLEATTLGFNAYQGQSGQRLAIEINRTFDGYESGDAVTFSGMAERRATWEAGLVYEEIIGGGQIRGGLMQDISYTHEGYSVRVDYERSFWKDESHLVTWFVGGEYWDSAKTDYYFGVKPTEAQADRAEYSASESHILFLGANALKQLGTAVTLLFRAEYRAAGNAIVQSPLVSRDNQLLTYGGLLYRF